MTDAGKPRNKVSEWNQLSPSLGSQLCADLKQSCGSVRADSIMRRFCEWLVSHPNSHADLLAIYKGEPMGLSDGEIATRTASVLSLYLETNKVHFKDNWQRVTQADIGRVLQALGEIPERRYPPFYPRLMPTPRVRPRSRPVSLGRLQWPELDGIAPPKREAAALELVAGASRLLFEQGEALFRFGQSVLSTDHPPASADPEAWKIVKSVLTSLSTELATTGSCGMDRSYEAASLSDVWVNAGLQPEFVPKRSMYRLTVHLLALGCLGATSSTTTAVKALLSCRTGWNRSQIEDLAAVPFAFREDDESGLGESAFLAAYKARAGHFVSALLERGFRTPVLSDEQRQIVWEGAKKDAPGSASTLLSDRSLIEIMDRYSELTKPVRGFDRSGKLSDYFFVSLAYNGLSRSSHGLKVSDEFSLLSRSGVNYQSIRGSFTSVTRRRLGTLEATKHATSHTGTAILLRHYDDPELQQELDESIAFWQRCIQAGMVRNEAELALRIEIPEADVEWFEHMAIVAGVTASLGIKGRKLSLSERPFIDFVPSHASFEEIYLIRRAIFAARQRIGLKRWVVQTTALLGLVNALRRYTFDAGLGERYALAVRTAYGSLSKSAIALPRIFEI